MFERVKEGLYRIRAKTFNCQTSARKLKHSPEKELTVPFGAEDG
jgi:hypothetical protein